MVVKTNKEKKKYFRASESRKNSKNQEIKILRNHNK